MKNDLVKKVGKWSLPFLFVGTSFFANGCSNVKDFNYKGSQIEIDAFTMSVREINNKKDTINYFFERDSNGKYILSHLNINRVEYNLFQDGRVWKTATLRLNELMKYYNNFGDSIKKSGELEKYKEYIEDVRVRDSTREANGLKALQ